MNTPISDLFKENTLPENAIIRKEGHSITTSLIVAEVFGKQHKDVLKTIRTLECPEEFSRRNFAPREYLDERGKMQPMVEMTRDGWTILVMGFSGKLAGEFKVAYIELFNHMEANSNDCNYTHKQIKGYRKRIKTLQETLISSNTRLRKVKHYLVLGLNYNEIAKLLDCNRKTIKKDAQKLANCGLFEFTMQNQLGKSQGKHYPQET